MPATLPAAVAQHVRRGADGCRRPVRGRAQQRLRAGDAARDGRTRRVHGDRPCRRLQCRHRRAVQRHGRARRGLRRHLRGRAGTRGRGDHSGAACHGGAARPHGWRRRARRRRRLRSHVPPVPGGTEARAQGGISSHRGVRRAGRGSRRELGPASRRRAMVQRARHRRQHGFGHHRIPRRRRVDQAHASRLGGAGGLSRRAHGAGGLHRPANAVRRRARLLPRVRQQRRLRLRRHARRRGRAFGCAADIAFKPYACGTMAHPYIDCARKLVAEGVSPERRRSPSSARPPKASCTACGSRSRPSRIRPMATPRSSAFPTPSRSACCAATRASTNTRMRSCTIPRSARSRARCATSSIRTIPIRANSPATCASRSSPAKCAKRVQGHFRGGRDEPMSAEDARGEIHGQLRVRRLERRTRTRRARRAARDCAPHRESTLDALRG